MGLLSGSTLLSNGVERFRSEPRVAHLAPDEGRIPDERTRLNLASLDDSALLELSGTGNVPAFDELVVRYRSKVMRLVSSILGADAEVEDVVQEIFIKVYLSLARFRGDSSFSTYLYTITVNRCRDELRKTRLRKFFSFDEWFTDGNADLSHDNEQQLDCNERQLAVRRAMKRMPAQTQMLLYLREIEELSYKELADIFSVEIGTIKSRLARGRDRLREELLPYVRDGRMPEEV